VRHDARQRLQSLRLRGRCAHHHQRRRAIVDGVYAPFRMNDLMAGILGRYFGEIGEQLHLEIHDGAGSDAGSLLFSSGAAGAGDVRAFAAVRTIDLFGRQWTLRVHTLPAFHERIVGYRANLVAAAGAVGSGLLALIVWLLPYQTFDALQTVAAHALRGFKVTLLPMFLHTLCFWGLGLGGGYWATYHGFGRASAPTVAGFWEASVAATVLATLLFSLLLRRVLAHQRRSAA